MSAKGDKSKVFERIFPSQRWVRVQVGDEFVAETKRPSLLFETSLPVRYYIPTDDVNMTYLTATNSQTRCPYKGIAS